MPKQLGDFFPVELANGNSIDAKVIHKFGSNPDVGTTMEDIWQTGGVYTWLQSAVTLEAISDSADDIITGSGARKVIVQGLDPDFKYRS